MIKVVLIDDERPALLELEYLLEDYTMVEVAGMFTNPLEALEKIIELKPQVVFLDMDMPQIKGIDVASRILDSSPDIDIIFVTAHDQYALEAFELNALDYMLKPLSRERFEKALVRVMKNRNEYKKSGKRLKISCLGKFQTGWAGDTPIKWRTEKTKELFAYLLHNRGIEVSKDQIIEALWPDCDIEKAVHQIHNGIYYIRNSLRKYGVDKSQINITGNYCLSLEEVDLDVELLQDSILEIKNNLTASSIGDAAMYSGEYLEGEDWLWADLEREKISRSYCEYVINLSEKLMEEKQYSQAERYLKLVFNKNPLNESVTRLLLNLYKMTGNKTSAVICYSEYARFLSEDLGILPDESITREYHSIE